jgi:hypothetical protein
MLHLFASITSPSYASLGRGAAILPPAFLLVKRCADWLDRRALLAARSSKQVARHFFLRRIERDGPSVSYWFF